MLTRTLKPLKGIALRLGIDMHLFDVGAKALEKGENVTLEQLSEETKCEALLISESFSAPRFNMRLKSTRKGDANSGRNEDVQ